MTEQLRTRKQTRAAVLGCLLSEGGMVRTRLAAACHLSEASISRIVAELREDALVTEIRQPAPYPGGPTQIVALRGDQSVAALEIANDRLTVGVGSLTGEVAWLERLALPAGAGAAAVGECLDRGIAALSAWCAQHGVVPRRLAAAIPGYRAGTDAANPIIALDPAWLRRRLETAFPGIPAVPCNAVSAHAAMRLHGAGLSATAGRHLFLHLGHGVGGAWVEPFSLAEPIRPIEIGHVVLDPEGPECRCGHRGCLEAVASSAALAALFEVEESALVVAGDHWPDLVRLTPAREARLRAMLRAIGIAIGNALNVMPVSLVALSGWPGALPPALRDAVEEGMARSLFGGLAGTPVPLRFLPSATGTEPRPALAYALHDLVREGGLPSPLRDGTTRLAG